MTAETVAFETSAREATSLIVGLPMAKCN